MGPSSWLRGLADVATVPSVHVHLLLLRGVHSFYADRHVLLSPEVVPEVQDPAGQRGLHTPRVGHADPHLLEPCPLHPTGRNGAVGVAASDSTSRDGAASVGVCLAPGGSTADLRLPVLCLALDPPQGV